MKRAYAADLRWLSLCGAFTMLGAAAAVYMATLCARAGRAGSAEMLLLLDGAELLLILLLLLGQLRFRALCRRELTPVRAAVDRSGRPVLVYWAGETRFRLKLPRRAALPRDGMTGLRVDPQRPRRVVLGSGAVPGFLAAGMLAGLTALINAVFFLIR